MINELSSIEIYQVNGAGFIDDLAAEIGYGIGYFYENVMLSDGWIDDLASADMP